MGRQDVVPHFAHIHPAKAEIQKHDTKTQKEEVLDDAGYSFTLDGCQLNLYVVEVIWENNGRFKLLGFFKVHGGVGHDDNQITFHGFSGSSSIEGNGSRSAFTFDDIGSQSFAIVDIEYLNFFVLNKIGSIHQVFVDGNTPHIVEVGHGNGSSVYF